MKIAEQEMPMSQTIVHKPWGLEDWFIQTEKYVGKYLHINAGEALSLQYHREKMESMRVISGTGSLTLGEPGKAEQEAKEIKGDVLKGAEFQTILEGDTFTIPPNTLHSIRAITPLKILEISSPEVGDLVRVRDSYDRT